MTGGGHRDGANRQSRRTDKEAGTRDEGRRKMELTKDQREALEAMRAGRNVLLTGDAGTGKSHVVDTFLRECEKNGRATIALAPTGAAALNLHEGLTIHRALGLKPEFQDPEKPIGFTREVLKNARTIVMDEFSMCRIDLFERLVSMIQAAERESGKKQLVVAGDPFQLPPVVSAIESDIMLERYESAAGYCFLSPLWEAMGFEPHVLREVVRQRGDSRLSRMLSLARMGDRACLPYFNEHALPSRDSAPEEAIWLCPTRRAARKINAKRLAALDGEEHAFQAELSGNARKCDKVADDVVRLKVGARVMALANDLDSGYANGSLGTVISIDPDAESPVRVVFDSGTTASIGWHRWETRGADQAGEGGFVTQIPLRLAWAITIHKSQGQSFDNVCVDTRAFEKGQLYVALSRARTFDGLHVYPRVEGWRLRADRNAVAFYEEICEAEREASQKRPLQLSLDLSA